MKIKTHIAPVVARYPANILGPLEDSAITLTPLHDASDEPLNWFDALCGGGLALPEDLTKTGEGRGRSQVMLLSGAAGTLKSTFAIQLCCSRAAHEKKTFRAIYVSSEQSAQRLIQRVKDIGMEGAASEPSVIFPFTDKTILGPNTKGIAVLGIDDVCPSRCPRKPEDFFKELAARWRSPEGKLRKQATTLSEPLDVFVIDSLNVIANLESKSSQIEVFEAIQEHIATPPLNPSLIIIVLDASHDQEVSRYWEYVSDIVFRFGWSRRDDHGYTLRSFEVVKMRDQYHAWGIQRLKVASKDSQSPSSLKRRSPYLTHGGVYVFPSVHWRLSQYSRIRTIDSSGAAGSERVSFPPSVGELNAQVSDGSPEMAGVPAGLCTALIGPRGVMKSHLAYYHLLYHAARSENPIPGLLISFRDNLASAKATLDRIANEECVGSSDVVDKLISKDLLEIIENEVGMISAEEFFHKVFVALHRSRAQNGQPTSEKSAQSRAKLVVINGLDQLETRFPLIAAESMFVPALIQMLKHEGATCLVTSAVGEMSTQPHRPSLYGLLPMAELILRFNRPEDLNARPVTDAGVPQDVQQLAEVVSERVPGGSIGGLKGFLYRDPKTKRLCYCR